VGSGILLDNMERAGLHADYTGVDVSPSFLGVVKQKYPDVRLVRHDFDDTLPFGDECFDIVYARHVFEHLKHYIFVLVEISRVCLEELIVVLFRPLLDGPDEINFRARKGTYYNSYNRDELLKACRTLFDEVSLTVSEGNSVGPSHQGRNWILHCSRRR
jgi:ubiquinone/menaquinone biosynthesis C-methylase UbiE